MPPVNDFASSLQHNVYSRSGYACYFLLPSQYQSGLSLDHEFMMIKVIPFFRERTDHPFLM
ncbi:hypothetical protein ESA_01407 [Cronobacter sakazakii ATCC BAA-894]|uniref:Uncharacterized protein n=1 Tax=Cronobacter sakazakii (strain ATCC BAA-894) TaxID=290339 RepID=A7MKG9_CROS8|nr:hypothetical protein ESA_01407 [Cronobacter sakazakii ATCC BAA-894]